MNERYLILLGLLMSESQHGYQLNEFIDKNLRFITDMKKPTAYSTLDKLCDKGYVVSHFEQEGNRPPRKVFSINEKGKEYFLQLLIENLSSQEMVYFDGDIGLMFIDYLSEELAVNSLKKRIEHSKHILEELKKTPKHVGLGANIAIEHKKRMMETEISFLQEIIEKLQSKRIDM